PTDCASRDEATSVFVGGADWFLSSNLDRRTLLKGASSAAFGLLASACGASGPATSASTSATSTAPARSAPTVENRETVYVLNVAGDTLIAFIDLAHGTVDATLQTGAFP